MRWLPSRLLWSTVVSISFAAAPLYGAAADEATPSSAILMMNGSWATDYNRCVEPFVVFANDESIKFAQHSRPDHVEKVVKVEAGTVYSKSLDDGSDNVYQVERDKIAASDSAGHHTTVVRCWGLHRPIDSLAACKKTVQKFGTSAALVTRLRARFEKIGISPYIDLHSLSEDSSGCVLHFTFLDDANKLLTLSSIECEPLYLGEKQPLYRLSDDGDLSLNYQVLNDRRPHDARFESCFEEKNGMSIWDKVIVLVYNEFLIPLKAINLSAPLSGCSSFSVWYDRGAARFRETGCTAGISAKRPILVPAPTVAGATVSASVSQAIDVDAVEKTFGQILSKYPGADISVLDRDDDHITYVVRGLRNQVIVGSNYWEKLTVNVFIWRNFATLYGGGDQVERGFHSLSDSAKPWGVKQSLQFRVITEGSYSAGSGRYPKDEFFTQNMEPEFHNQLTEFANRLAKQTSDNSVEKAP